MGCKQEETAAKSSAISDAAPVQEKWLVPVSGDSALMHGQEVWKGTCRRCHEPGLVGAPRIASADWGPRIAKGLDTLISHAIHGFEGKTGNLMPAKGGNSTLSEEDVSDAVRFMVSQHEPQHLRP
jgi:cytochrome c5